jgi:hypothetical protein
LQQARHDSVSISRACGDRALELVGGLPPVGGADRSPGKQPNRSCGRANSARLVADRTYGPGRGGRDRPRRPGVGGPSDTLALRGSGRRVLRLRPLPDRVWIPARSADRPTFPAPGFLRSGLGRSPPVARDDRVDRHWVSDSRRGAPRRARHHRCFCRSASALHPIRMMTHARPTLGLP